MTRRKRWVLGGVLVAMFVAGALIGNREHTGERGPSGTLALKRMLTELGYDVRTADDPPPPPATFVLLTDFRDEEASARLQQWIDSGGRLVLADPEALIAGLVQVEPAGRVGTLGPARLHPSCVSPIAAHVSRLYVEGGAPSISSHDPTSIACFPASRGSFVVSARSGDGQVFVLANPSPLTNEFLRRGDNAMFAVNVLDAGGPIVFGAALPAGEEAARGGLWQTLPPIAKAAVVQLVLAVVLFSLVRARRLGRAIPEAPRAPIPAGELVRATGRLLRSARATQHAARLMRDHLARRVAARLGYGSAAMARSRAAELGEGARDALEGPEPLDDAALIALGRQLEETRKEMEGADR
jgi:hypothetical protein